MLAKVCFQQPDGSGFAFVCEPVVDLQADSANGVYRTYVAAKYGVSVGWQMVNYGRVYRVIDVIPKGRDSVVVLRPKQEGE